MLLPMPISSTPDGDAAAAPPAPLPAVAEAKEEVVVPSLVVEAENCLQLQL